MYVNTKFNCRYRRINPGINVCELTRFLTSNTCIYTHIYIYIYIYIYI